MNVLSDTESEVSDIEVEVGIEEELRNELVDLADKGLIRKTSAQIRRMKLPALERIKQNYLANQTENVTDLISKTVIRTGTRLLESYNLVDDADTVHDDLTSNEIFMGEVKSLITNVALYIPYIGIGLGAMIVFGHVKSGIKKVVDDRNDL